MSYTYKSTKPQTKSIDEEFVQAAKKIQNWLQEEENRQNGKKAKTISFCFATKYIYRNYLKGKSYGSGKEENGLGIFK